MATTVEICNIALAHIGQRAIASLDENSESARRCSQFFNMQRDAVLRACNWHFASKIVELAQVESTIPGWSFLYEYPADCLFIRKVAADFSEVTRVKPVPFKRVQIPDTTDQGIACNLENALAEYTYQVEDPERFDALFMESLTYKLAASLAQPLTGDMNMGKSMLQTYATLIDEAKRINGSEGSNVQDQTSSYQDVR